MLLFDLGEGASSHPEQVWQAVVVQVDDAAAPSDIPGLHTQPSSQSDIFKPEPALIPVQSYGIFCEMGLQHVERAIGVEITDADTHAGLFVAVLVHGQAPLQSLLLKGIVPAVVKEQAGSGIAGQVD